MLTLLQKLPNIVFRPISELQLKEVSKDQYMTRHLPDGRIIFADHRYLTKIPCIYVCMLHAWTLRYFARGDQLKTNGIDE